MLKNSPFSFAVILPNNEIDRNGFYKVTFLEWVAENCPELSISGVDDPTYTKAGNFIRGLDFAGPGKLLTVGRGPNHDLNWIDDPQYALDNGVLPVYDLLKDIKIVKEQVLKYYKAKYPKVRTNDTNAKDVTFTRIGDYIRVGVNTYRDTNEYVANIPVSVLATLVY
jgi:hypothetical protein